MNSTVTKLSKWAAAAAFVALTPLTQASTVTVLDFDGTFVVGTLNGANDMISITVGGFVAGGSYTFSFETDEGANFRPDNLGLVFADYGRDTQDNFGFSVGFTALSAFETLTFDYLLATDDEDFVQIFAGLIRCDLNCDPVTPMPEPGTMALVGLALTGMGFASRRRKTS